MSRGFVNALEATCIKKVNLYILVVILAVSMHQQYGPFARFIRLEQLIPFRHFALTVESGL